MERGIFRRKRPKKEQIDNLYKILGTRSNISQDRIKEKYIEKLREFPPETYPEEFQDIRRAYETLKDPKKRKQYDMMRKYGDKIENIMEEAMYLMSNGNWKQAKSVLKTILDIDPDNTVINLTMAEVLLELEEFDEFNSIMDSVLEKTDNDEKELIIFIKFGMLHSRGYGEESLKTLNQGFNYITDMMEYHRLRIMAFIDNENYMQAWGEFKYIISPSQNPTIEDLDIFILWLFIAMELEKWGELSKIQNQIKKLFKAIEDEEELFIVKSQLWEEVESYVDAARYREADVVMQLLSQLDRKDIEIEERRKEIQAIAKIDMDLSRLMKDSEVIPYVSIKLLELYLSKYAKGGPYEEFLNDYPYDMMNEMEGMNLEIGYGIIRVKKKFSSLYREFNEELESLFNEVTAGLNREQKRSLR